MICKIIQKVALFIFWNCIPEKQREKDMQEHNYSKINAEQVDSVLEKIRKSNHTLDQIHDEIKEINILIESNTIEVKDIHQRLKNIERALNV